MRQNLLEQAGLNKNEANVYKIVLEHGEIAPPQVAELSGLTRQNAYAVLKSLTQKELIEELEKKKKLTYRPQHPTKLLEYVERKKEEMLMTEKSIHSMIPMFSSIYNLSTNKPGITYFEGIDGIKKIYEDTLKEKPDEILVFRSVHDIKMTTYIQGYVKRRARMGIKTRVISPTKPTKEKEILDKQLLRKRKFIPLESFSINAEVDIYKDQVAFITYDKKIMGFVISSRDVAQALTVFFNLIWNSN